MITCIDLEQKFSLKRGDIQALQFSPDGKVTVDFSKNVDKKTQDKINGYMNPNERVAFLEERIALLESNQDKLAKAIDVKTDKMTE